MSKFHYGSQHIRLKVVQRVAVAVVGLWGLLKLLSNFCMFIHTLCFPERFILQNRLTRIIANSDIPQSQPIVGKVTMIYGNNSIYERALETHQEHSRRLGYPLLVLHRPILDGTFNKYAILLSAMLQELQKPPDRRLQWLL